MNKVVDFLMYTPVKSMLAYGILSVCYCTFNRVIMTKFFFDYPIVLLIMQMAVLLFGIEVLRVTSSVKLHAYTFQRGKDVFPASLLYIMSHFLNLNCLDGTTMPLFPFIQRFTPLLIIELNRHFNRKARPSRFDMGCIGVICLSAAAASVYDWSFDLWSIIYGIVAVCMESYALFLMEKLKDQYNSWLEVLYMHAFNCLCVLLVADLIQDEIRDSFMYLATSTTFLFVIILTIMVAIGVGFQVSLFYCLNYCGALHSSMINILASGIQLFVAYGLSVFLFYDLNPTWTNVFGVIIASCVAIYYYIVNRALDAGNTYMPTKYGIEKS